MQLQVKWNHIEKAPRVYQIEKEKSNSSRKTNL